MSLQEHTDNQCCGVQSYKTLAKPCHSSLSVQFTEQSFGGS